MDPEEFRSHFDHIVKQIEKQVVGQREVIEQVLIALFSGGHVLLEGVPGLGKTQLVRTLSQTLGLDFRRIQFTPDLMPADIVGANVLIEGDAGQKVFEFQQGPIFAQLVLGDEINRATPRTQSAMLEAMQEHTVSMAGHTYSLPKPFFVLATQNPIEMEGTYRLPEAQSDRFFFKVDVRFPRPGELSEILKRTTGEHPPSVGTVINSKQILDMQALVRQVPVASHVEEKMIQILYGTHPENPEAPDSVQRFVRLGPSVRGLQAISLAARAVALIEGRYNVAMDDIHRVTQPALRHRVLLNFDAEAEGVSTETLITEVLDACLGG